VRRPGPAIVHPLSAVLKECAVPRARSSPAALRRTPAGQAECIACATAPEVWDQRRISTALGTARLLEKKRPDAVDALVAWTAVKHRSAVVSTGDPDDIAGYPEAFGADDVHLAPV